METCAKCNHKIYMSHPLDRCYHCDETVCPECQEKGTLVVICEMCLRGRLEIQPDRTVSNSLRA